MPQVNKKKKISKKVNALKKKRATAKRLKTKGAPENKKLEKYVTKGLTKKFKEKLDNQSDGLPILDQTPTEQVSVDANDDDVFLDSHSDFMEDDYECG